MFSFLNLLKWTPQIIRRKPKPQNKKYDDLDLSMTSHSTVCFTSYNIQDTEKQVYYSQPQIPTEETCR